MSTIRDMRTTVAIPARRSREPVESDDKRRADSPRRMVWHRAGGTRRSAGAWLLLAAWEEGLSGGRDFVQDYAAVVKIGQGRNPYEPYNDVTQELFGGPPHRGPLYSFHAPSSLPLLIWLLPFATALGVHRGVPGLGDRQPRWRSGRSAG